MKSVAVVWVSFLTAFSFPRPPSFLLYGVACFCICLLSSRLRTNQEFSTDSSGGGAGGLNSEEDAAAAAKSAYTHAHSYRVPRDACKDYVCYIGDINRNNRPPSPACVLRGVLYWAATRFCGLSNAHKALSTSRLRRPGASSVRVSPSYAQNLEKRGIQTTNISNNDSQTNCFDQLGTLSASMFSTRCRCGTTA